MRSQLFVRSAVSADVPVLRELWSVVVRKGDEAEQLADLQTIVTRAAGSDTERVVVIEHDGQVAGAVYLRVATVSPINLEPIVQVLAPHVLPQHRRHGIGRALLDAAVAFAEERGVAHVGAAVPASSRDGNRFMARLGLGPVATYRLALTQTVRAKLELQRPPLSRTSGRHLSHVLAARRSMRRHEHTVNG